MFKHDSITLEWLGHDGFIIRGSIVICIDPFKVAVATPADLILITHEHFDHMSVEDIRKFVKKDTMIICPPACAPALREFPKIVTMKPGQDTWFGDAKVTTVPAYNTNKYRDPMTKTVFHPKEDGKLGYVVTLDGTTVYHAGDTDDIPEMVGLAPDIALLPVSGTYVMTAEEAAHAATSIRPKIAIPMHYGGIVGTDQDAKRFKELLADSDIQVEILEHNG